MGLLDAIFDERIFLGYSTRSKAYRWYNKKLKKILESTNVRVSEEWNHVAPELEVEIEDTPITIEEKDIPQDKEEPITEEKEPKKAPRIRTKYVQKKHSEY